MTTNPKFMHEEIHSGIPQNQRKCVQATCYDKVVTLGLQTFKKKNLRQIIFVLLLVLPLYGFAAFYMYENSHISTQTPLKTNYLIENLKGDTVDTWKSWNISERTTLIVNIVNANDFPQDKIDAIKDAILSEKSISIEDSQLHESTDSTQSTYYLGWYGALETIADKTESYIPKKFVIIESPHGEGDITITLSNLENADGYSGYTKSVTDRNQILKSSITIYNVNELTPGQLTTITRHEFGHALGLGHSTDPNDLMYATIQTDYPYISQCDIHAITSLYDGSQSSKVVCEK